MAARILTSRAGPAAAAARRRRPLLPGPAAPPAITRAALRPSSSMSSASSPASTDAGEDGPGGKPGRPLQSFVDPNVELTLGELELELPPGFHTDHHRKQRGFPYPRPDGDGRDSYWRPPFANKRVEVISAQDFANRPRVTFSESYASMYDAMTTLTWMTQKDKDEMYRLYVEMMQAIAEKSDAQKKVEERDMTDKDWDVLSAHTSHEYVIRVIAQKFNVTSSRAAGVIHLQHREEQHKKDPTFAVRHDLQKFVDEKIRDVIRETYQEYGEKDPLQFFEEPIASSGNVPRENAESPVFFGAPELTDVDALTRRVRNRELDDARRRIREHVYIEDVDDRTRKVVVDREAKRLMRMQETLGGLYDDLDQVNAVGADADEGGEGGEGPSEEGSSDAGEGGGTEVPEAYIVKEDAKKATKSKKKNGWSPPSARKPTPELPPVPDAASPLPENGAGHKQVAGSRRPRWKYVAQIINTYDMENPQGSNRRGKGVARWHKGKRHGRILDGNTVIEEGGKLRVASVAELESTSWKHVRNESEFMFKGAKDAWLQRQLEGEVDGWGYQEEVEDERALAQREGWDKKVWVGNISWATRDAELEERFREMGELKSAKVVMKQGKNAHISKGWGYVKFVDVESAKRAVKELNGAVLDGRPMIVEYNKHPRPIM
ncbi:hypothetical protein ACHAWF_013316 [Thalassiosira exigua]